MKKIQLLNNIKIYPNPANDLLKIELPDYLENLQIKLVDLSGRTIYSQIINTPISSMDTKEIANGVYLLKVSLKEKGEITRKVIVQH